MGVKTGVAVVEKGMFEIADIEASLSIIAMRLVGEFTGVFSRETVERYVRESYTLLNESATVRVHLASLSERFAKDRLKALAQSQSIISKDKPEILFVCVHNAGRSQMAAALALNISKGAVSVRSAGSAPADSIPQAVHDAMNEIGLDLAQEFPKPLTDEVVRAADVVITMGCGDACPIYPGKRYEDWQLEDPATLNADGVRAVRDEIETRIRTLLSELQVI
jgi:protein-tyrosine-phosphatase